MLIEKGADIHVKSKNGATNEKDKKKTFNFDFHIIPPHVQICA